MLTAIIFSKNRACQLDLLLRSIRKNLPIFDRILILYTYTSDDFKKGYEVLRYKHYNTIYLLKQTDFKKNTIQLINDSSEMVCFFVDDNIIYRKNDTKPKYIKHLFINIEDFGCFSFRLGFNTIVQNPYSNPPRTIQINQPIKQINFTVQDENTQHQKCDCSVYVWEWDKLPHIGNNFGYGFSVDGHIYSKDVLLKSLDFDFDNPNAFEGRFDTKNIPGIMACCSRSSVVNNPLNLVGSSNNAAGKFYGHTLEELNDKFLDGKKISLESISKNNIIGCHQEMKIELI